MTMREWLKPPFMWKCEPSKPLVDNYNKTCHLLNLKFHPNIQEFSGTCSLCGGGNFIHNQRCMNCRAKIEDDTFERY